MSKTIPSLEETVARIKQEVIEDVKSGKVPADCPSFSALHDHVDANEYGGFCEDGCIAIMTEYFDGNKNEGMPDKMVEYLNQAQNAIDFWIKQGGIVQDMALDIPTSK